MSLSSLIVQREVATIRQVEEALARQVLYGGDLVTNVLEVAQVPEALLVPLLAETSHMPHAPLGSLPPPTAAAMALVPTDLAVRRSLYPLDVVGDALVVAVAEPLAPDVVAELAFALGVLIEQRVAPLVRVREGLAAAYGAPLDRRMQRLVSRLAGIDTPGTGSLPPLLSKAPINSLSRPPSGAPPPSPKAAAPGAFRRRETPALGSFGRAESHSTSTGFPSPTGPASEVSPDTDKTERTPPVSSEPTPGPPAVVAHKIVHLGEPPESAFPLIEVATAKGPPPKVPAANATESATASPAVASASASAPTATSSPSANSNATPAASRTAPPPFVPVSTQTSPYDLGDGSQRASQPPPRRSSMPPAPHASSLVRLVQHESVRRSGRKRRGPVTLDRAKVELEQASDRDALLDLFFAFSLQFFEYSALFIVHGDIAEGRDAYGPGATRDQVVGIGVPLDLPSALSEARDRCAPVIARPARGGLDAVLAQDLARSADWPIVVVPIVVRGRTVAVLYGDNGDAGVDGPGAGEVTGFASRVGQAFERIIVRRKLAGFSGEASTAKPRVDPKRVAPKSIRPPQPIGREIAVGVLQKALSPTGFVRPPSVPPPAAEHAPARALEPEDAPARALEPAHAPEPAAAPGPSHAIPPPPVAPPPGPPPPSPAARERDGVRVPESNGPIVELDVDPDPDSGPDRDDDSEPELVLPLATRRTIRDIAPPFPDAVDDAIPAVATEFSDLPPPPQAAAVREISIRPIPREEPDAIQTDPPSPPRAPTSGPSIEVSSEDLDDAEAQKLLEDLERTDPELDTENLPVLHPSGGGVRVSSIRMPKAPPSQSLAVPPHKPPSPRARPDALPSVIVDASNEFLMLVDRLAKDPKDEHAEAELLRQGHHAMPSIMARFPGPITVSMAEIEEKRPRVGECGPILKLIAGQRRVALPFVLARVEDADPEARFWATFLLTELAYPEAVPAIVARLFDSDERTRRVARLAARVVAEGARESLMEELDRIVRDASASIDKRIRTMDALGEMRDAIVVPVLIGALGDESPEVAAAARRALITVSRQDFGKDTRKWLAWWSSNSARHRVEWLIDALTHEHAAMRKDAAGELKTITREYFGYYDDLPKRERERAQLRYRDWWRTEGRARFRRD